MMYFITALYHESDKIHGCRCVGYYDSFDKAKTAVENNACDICEDVYDYCVIEALGDGVFQLPEDKWFFMFNFDTRAYEPVFEPPQYKNVSIFCL